MAGGEKRRLGGVVGWACEVGMELGQTQIAPAFRPALGKCAWLRLYHPLPLENKANDVVI